MIAANHVGYDILFVVHLVGAIAVVVVLLSVRWVARHASTLAPEVLRRRCPDRPDRALRLVHLVPVTGVALSLRGGRDVSFSRPWIGVGIALYLVLAYLVEARVAPAERTLARDVVTGVAPAASARALVGRLDEALVVVAVLFATMIVQV